MTLARFAYEYTGNEYLTVFCGYRCYCFDWAYDTDEWDGLDWYEEAMDKVIIRQEVDGDRRILYLEE